MNHAPVQQHSTLTPPIPAGTPRDIGCAAGAAIFALLSIGVVLGYVNFARWDNMETFLPAIWWAHGELLRGRLPLWNPLQSLGEPMHALGIGGVLYPPYTIAVAVTKLLGFPAASALDLIAIMHATFGAVGMAKLLAELRVRRSIAFAASLGAMLSGFALVMSSIWVHVLPNLAWSIWAMWGLRRVIVDPGLPIRGIIVATIALGAVFHTGHAQSGANVWLAVWAWAFGLAIVLRAPARRWLTLVLIAVCAALLALPQLLPTALILPEADRLSRVTTPGAKFHIRALLGLIMPTLGMSDGARVHNVLILPFMGAWIVPGMVLGIGALMRRRPDHGSPARGHDPVQMRVFLVTVIAAVLFVLLSLGPPAKLFTVLHHLPLWSRFRDAYKYYERAVPLLVIAAALGLELAIRVRPSRRYPLTVLLLGVAGAIIWLVHPAKEPLVFIAGGVALMTMVGLAVLPHSSSAIALVAVAITQSVTLIGISHSPSRPKSYQYDRRTDARLPLENIERRVLPLSEGPQSHPFTRPLALFYAPMLDGYASATGHRFALTAARANRGMHATVAGVPSRRRESLSTLLASNFLKLADVGYLIVELADTAADHAVRRQFPDAPVTATQHARIFRIGARTPRMYFATHQIPGDHAGIFETLYGVSPLHSASVPGDQRRRELPPASVVAGSWNPDRASARVNAPQGGLLVFSTSYSPEWKAKIDGERVRVVPVDDLFAGVWVPPGAQLVALSVRRWPLYLGLLGALAGIAALWGVTQWIRQTQK